MTKPEPTVGGIEFDLAAIAEEMRAEAPYVRDGHTARTLVRSDDLRVVFVVMRAGATIAEHRAKNTISIQAIHGRVRVRFGARAAELAPGRLVSLEPGLAHDLEAIEEGSFLLTLGWASK